MRKICAVMVSGTLAAAVAQAEIASGPARIAPPVAAAARTVLQAADDRIVVPFTLSRETPTFTYRFSPPAAGTYTAAVHWDSAARPGIIARLAASEMKVTVTVAPLGLSQGGGPAYDFWVGIINEIVSWFGGNPDNLGMVEKAWTATDLQLMLQPGASTVGGLHFLNSDGKGSYYLEYAIERE